MDLFNDLDPRKLDAKKQAFAANATLLSGFALPVENTLLADLQQIIAVAPLRNMVTPGGFTMSVAMTNCGDFGWITDRKAYRYASLDPLSGKAWPALPDSFLQLAISAASETGFANFVPDACLINEYKMGVRMSLHQDRDEQDFSQPIVSVSLGLPAMFQFGGLQRADKTQKIQLNHGDVLVWGGQSRLRFHGVLPLKAGNHALLGARRINLTFRKAA